MRSKCKWRMDGVVLNEECNKVIRKWICDIDYYDKEIGCNPNRNGYCRAKENSNDQL